MTISAEPPLMAALKTKMRWHEARQGVLAENVANAATPGFRAQDLTSINPMRLTAPAVSVARTDAQHIAFEPADASGRAQAVGSFERTPDGNAVVLEEQMMKAAQNQMDHQMAATLYSKSLGLIRTALGRGR